MSGLKFVRLLGNGLEYGPGILFDPVLYGLSLFLSASHWADDRQEAFDCNVSLFQDWNRQSQSLIGAEIKSIGVMFSCELNSVYARRK